MSESKFLYVFYKQGNKEYTAMVGLYANIENARDRLFDENTKYKDIYSLISIQKIKTNISYPELENILPKKEKEERRRGKKT